MAQNFIANGDSGLSARNVINNNFTELYARPTTVLLSDNVSSITVLLTADNKLNVLPVAQLTNLKNHYSYSDGFETIYTVIWTGSQWKATREWLERGGDGYEIRHFYSVGNTTYPWQASWSGGATVNQYTVTSALSTHARDGNSIYAAKADHVHSLPTFLTVLSSGNVGINESSPEGKLHVTAGSAGTVTAQTSSVGVFESGGNAYLSLLSPTNHYSGVVMGGPTNPYGSYVSWNHDNLALKIATNHLGGSIQMLAGTEQESLRILSGGNVGIGTISPFEKLTVSGNISASGNIAAQSSTIPVTVTGVAANKTFSNVDTNKVFHFSTSSPLTAIFPSTLSDGFSVAIMNTGTSTLHLSTNGTYKAIGDVITDQYAGAYVYKANSEIFAVGGL